MGVPLYIPNFSEIVNLSMYCQNKLNLDGAFYNHYMALLGNKISRDFYTDKSNVQDVQYTKLSLSNSYQYAIYVLHQNL